MDIRISQNLRNLMAEAIRKMIDTGEATGTTKPGKIQIYSGIQPANPDTETTFQTLLVELILSLPCAPVPTDGALIFNEIYDGEALDTDKATWARITDGDGVAVFDCDVGTIGSGSTMELNTADIVQGGPIKIKNFTIMIP